MKKMLAVLFSALPFVITCDVLANMEHNGNLSVGFNDNISNAVSDRDIFEDQFISANYNISKLWVPQAGKSFLLGGHLGTEAFGDSKGLAQFSYGLSSSYIQRLGLGAYAPRFTLSYRADYRDFDSNNRDGWLYRTGILLEKRFLPELHASIAYNYERRTADKNRATAYVQLTSQDVFNQRNDEFSASIDYTFENGSVLTAQYMYRDGEIDASTNPGSEFFAFAKAIAGDPNICEACGNYVAYLINASSQIFIIDWNWALGRDTSVSANYERRLTDTAGDVTYDGNIFRIQLNRRF